MRVQNAERGKRILILVLLSVWRSTRTLRSTVARGGEKKKPCLARQTKQPSGIAVIDHVAMGRWAIKPVKELRRHLVGAEGMVGPEQQMLRTEHVVATGKRLVVIADGVNIESGEIVANRSRKARRFGDER